MVDGPTVALDVTWTRAMKVWWALVWRAALAGLVVGAILGALGGIGVALTGRGDPGTVGGALGTIGSLPASIYVVRQILRKRFRDFTIRLVPTGPRQAV
jgi:hypothetical protein